MAETTDLNRTHWQRSAHGMPVEWETLTAEPEGIDEEHIDDPDGLWLRPPDPLDGAVILAIHGGGFVTGSAAGTHRKLFGHLAAAAGVAVFAVEYGLVPDQVFPGQLDDVTSAYRWLLERGATRVAVAGDSCAALLALPLALRAREGRFRLPSSLLLFSGWVDLEASGSSYASGSDPFFTQELVRTLAAGYLGGADSRDPLAAPLFADLHGLPPTYLQVGGAESLLEDSRQLASTLRDAGVRVRLDEYPGELHTFQMTAGRTAVADDAIVKAGSWLRSTITS